MAINSPNQDLCFLQVFKDIHENVDKSISKAVLHEFIHRLWYLTNETATTKGLKVKMVANLTTENIRISTTEKRHVPSNFAVHCAVSSTFKY